MDLYPEGYYDATITGGQFGQTGTGKAQWALHFELTDGTKGTAFLSYEGGAKEYTREKLARVGYNGDLDNAEFSAPQCQVQCVHDEYQGKIRAKWDIAKGLEMAPASASMRDAFKRDWKANAPAPAGKTTGAPAKPPARTTPNAAPSRPAASSGSAPSRTAAPSRSAPPAPKKDKQWAWDNIENVKQDAFFAAIEQVEKDQATTEDVFGPDQWEEVVRVYLPI